MPVAVVNINTMIMTMEEKNFELEIHIFLEKSPFCKTPTTSVLLKINFGNKFNF